MGVTTQYVATSTQLAAAVVTPAKISGGSQSIQKIATVVGAGTPKIIQFTTGFDSAQYTRYIIKGFMASGAGTPNLVCYLNTDQASGNYYSSIVLAVSNTAPTSSAVASNGGSVFGPLVTTPNEMVDIEIEEYDATSEKQINCTQKKHGNTGTHIYIGVGAWASATRISKITLQTDDGSDLVGTATLFGVIA